MSSRDDPPPGPRRVKPRVAIVYTGQGEETAASYHFAHYFGACLYLTGYSSVRLVPYVRGGASKRKSKAEPLPAQTEVLCVP